MLDANEAQLAELDKLLNDPDVAMEPARIWEIVDEIAERAVVPTA